MPNPIVTAETPRGMEDEIFKKVERFLLPLTMTTEVSIPMKTAISVARRAKYSEFHKEEIGAIGTTFVRFVKPVKKEKISELPKLSERSTSM
tara:strand:- start:41 stop:316 length:276 start_codon:yes stop_codon:yes gene_type:complete